MPYELRIAPTPDLKLTLEYDQGHHWRKAAAALKAGCTLIATNDPDLCRVEELPVVVLEDLLKEESQV